MHIDLLELEKQLTPTDRHLLEKFITNLLKKKKYAHLRKEIEQRRQEVAKGEYLTHEDFWNEF